MLKIKINANFIIFLCSIIIIGSYFLPILSKFIPTVILSIIVICAYSLILINTNWHKVSSVKYSAAIILALFVFFIIDDRYKTGFVGVYALLIYMFPVLCTFYFFKKEQYDYLEKLAYFMLIILGITAITTYFGLVNHPEMSRILATGQDSDAIMESINGNIGGFHFIYCFALSAPLYIWGINNKVKSRILKVALNIFVICFTFMVLIKAQYTLGLLLWIIAVIFSLLINKISFFKLVLINCVIIFIFFRFSTEISRIFLYLADTVNSDIISQRFVEISSTIAGQTSATSDIALRTEVYAKSFEAFLEHPILGGWLYNVTSGGHSFVLDLLARGGIVFGGIILGLLVKLTKFYFDSGLKKNKYYLIFLFVFFLLCILNPINSSGGFLALLYTLPVGLSCSQKSMDYGES